jgi:hypothetical protein
MNTRALRLVSVFACVAAVATVTVHADWTAVAATAAIDEGDLNKILFNNDGSATIRPTISSTSAKLRVSIVKTPSLVVPNPRPDELGPLVFMMRARDNGPGARVIATLKRITFGYFGGPERTDVVATIDSDMYQAGSDWATMPVNSFNAYNPCCFLRNPTTGTPEALNFLDSAYYVEIQLIKNNAEGNPGVLSVGILRDEP